MTVTTVPDPQHQPVDRRLSHEPPAAIAKRGWRYHHIGQGVTPDSRGRLTRRFSGRQGWPSASLPPRFGQPAPRPCFGFACSRQPR
jgi:hypothetical protein